MPQGQIWSVHESKKGGRREVLSPNDHRIAGPFAGLGSPLTQWGTLGCSPEGLSSPLSSTLRARASLSRILCRRARRASAPEGFWSLLASASSSEISTWCQASLLWGLFKDLRQHLGCSNYLPALPIAVAVAIHLMKEHDAVNLSRVAAERTSIPTSPVTYQLCLCPLATFFISLAVVV